MKPLERTSREQAFRDFLGRDGNGTDPAHDGGHVERVVRSAKLLGESEGAELEVVWAAAWLHDCVHVPKDSPDRSQASRFCAGAAREFLLKMGCPDMDVDAITHAIEAHSFTAAIEPQTLEAKVVQDADRLDALGAHGLARNLMLAGSWGAGLAHPTDPWAQHRLLDDRAWAVDHFFAKLLTLAGTMKTESGRREALRREGILRMFLVELARERGIDPPPPQQGQGF